MKTFNTQGMKKLTKEDQDQWAECGAEPRAQCPDPGALSAQCTAQSAVHCACVHYHRWDWTSVVYYRTEMAAYLYEQWGLTESKKGKLGGGGGGGGGGCCEIA